MKNLKGIIIFLIFAGALGALYYFNRSKLPKITIEVPSKKQQPEGTGPFEGFPLCLIPQTDEEKEKKYSFIVIVKKDYKINIWIGKNYKPITALPFWPDKTGEVIIEGDNINISISDGKIRDGKILEWDEATKMPSKLFFTLDDNSTRILSHAFCNLD